MSDSRAFEVVWPLSKRRDNPIDNVKTLDGFEGKKIAFIWDYLFKGREMFEIIEEEVKRSYPGVEFFGPDGFGNILKPGNDPEQVLREMGPKLDALGIDGAIVGVGA